MLASTQQLSVVGGKPRPSPLQASLKPNVAGTTPPSTLGTNQTRQRQSLYNWGCALDFENPSCCLVVSSAPPSVGAAGEHYVQALKDNPKKHEPPPITGIRSGYRQPGTLPTSPSTACGLRHAMPTIEIKPDNAKRTVGSIMVTEAQFLAGKAARCSTTSRTAPPSAPKSIRPGPPPYNLACVRSLKGDLSAALEACAAPTPPTRLADAAHLAPTPTSPLRASPPSRPGGASCSAPTSRWTLRR